MNTTAIPTTLTEVQALPNHIHARTQAEAYVEVGNRLTTPGPIVSKKVLFDKETNKLVYEFYRARNKEEKVYVIF